MKIKDMSKQELEIMSNGDLTEYILKEKGKPMSTPSIFKCICDIHEYTEAEYTAKIGEYYTSLTTDKRFILLDSAEWDLRDNHAVKIDIDDIEEEEDLEEIEEVEEEEEEAEVEEAQIDDTIDEDELDVDDDVEDDIEDLAIVEEEDIDA